MYYMYLYMYYIYIIIKIIYYIIIIKNKIFIFAGKTVCYAVEWTQLTSSNDLLTFSIKQTPPAGR